MAKLITELKNKVAHVSMFFKASDGYLYCSYYADDVEPLEKPTNPTTKCYLEKIDPTSHEVVRRWLASECGMTIAGETIGSERGCYEASLAELGGKIYYTFLCWSDGDYKYRTRVFDLQKQAWDDVLLMPHIVVGDERFEVSEAGLTASLRAYNGKTAEGLGIWYIIPILTNTFTKHDDEYYFTVTIAAKNFGGYVVKTKDFRDYTIVTEVPNKYGDNLEITVEPVGDYLYLPCRGNKGQWMYVYDLRTGTIVFDKWTSDVDAKPGITSKDGEVWYAHNIKGSYIQSSKGVLRSILAVDRCSFDGSRWHQRRAFTIRTKFGAHYPCVKFVDGELVLTYTTDRRGISTTKDRSEIMIERVKV